MNLIFFFILAFNDGTFVIERWPTIEICKQQASDRELIFRGGGSLARSPIGVSECEQEVPTLTRHVIRAATIDANNGAGVALSERSTAVLFSANVTNNTANGVQLMQGSGVVFRPNAPLSVISSNTSFDLKCFDTKSSITTGYAGSPTIDGCTEF